MLIPVHRSEHWSLVVVSNLAALMQRLQKGSSWKDLPKKLRPTIIYLDPLWKADKNVGLIVELFLEAALQYTLGSAEYINKRFEINDGDFLLNEHTLEDFQALVPRQQNTYDCGLFVLEYIEMFSTNDRTRYFIDHLYAKGHLVRWFPYSLINNKRVLLINVMMNYVNGLDINSCVEEYLAKKQYIYSVVGKNDSEYDSYPDTEGLDHLKVDEYYDSLPAIVGTYNRTQTKTTKAEWGSPALTEVD